MTLLYATLYTVLLHTTGYTVLLHTTGYTAAPRLTCTGTRHRALVRECPWVAEPLCASSSLSCLEEREMTRRVLATSEEKEEKIG